MVKLGWILFACLEFVMVYWGLERQAFVTLLPMVTCSYFETEETELRLYSVVWPNTMIFVLIWCLAFELGG